jgi:hypothetical protein
MIEDGRRSSVLGLQEMNTFNKDVKKINHKIKEEKNYTELRSMKQFCETCRQIEVGCNLTLTHY